MRLQSQSVHEVGVTDSLTHLQSINVQHVVISYSPKWRESKCSIPLSIQSPKSRLHFREQYQLRHNKDTVLMDIMETLSHWFGCVIKFAISHLIADSKYKPLAIPISICLTDSLADDLDAILRDQFVRNQSVGISVKYEYGQWLLIWIGNEVVDLNKSDVMLEVTKQLCPSLRCHDPLLPLCSVVVF